MAENDDLSNVQRWTAKRRSALVLHIDILKTSFDGRPPLAPKTYGE